MNLILSNYTDLHLIKAIWRVGKWLLLALVLAVIINHIIEKLEKKTEIRHKKSPRSSEDISKSA